MVVFQQIQSVPVRKGDNIGHHRSENEDVERTGDDTSKQRNDNDDDDDSSQTELEKLEQEFKNISRDIPHRVRIALHDMNEKVEKLF